MVGHQGVSVDLKSGGPKAFSEPMDPRRRSCNLMHRVLIVAAHGYLSDETY
jgi:hypothetical protein